MAVYTDFILATDADLPDLIKGGPESAFPGIYVKYVTDEYMCVLYELLTHQSHEQAYQRIWDQNIYAPENECFMINRLPADMVAALASLSETDHLRLAERCFEEEAELFDKVDEDVLQEFMDNLCDLARRVVSQSGYSIFHRMSC